MVKSWFLDYVKLAPISLLHCLKVKNKIGKPVTPKTEQFNYMRKTEI